MPTHPRTRRRSRVLVALLASLALLAPASSAFADVTEPPPSGGSGNGGGNGKNNPGAYGCTAKDERTENGTVFTRPAWPSCQPGKLSSRLDRRLCPTGMLVYRFYGYRDGRIAAATASRVHLPDNNCGAVAYKLFHPNAEDAPGAGRRTPFEVRAITNPYGERVAYAEPSAPRSGNPERLTSNPPIYRDGSCVSMQYDPLTGLLQNPSTPPAVRAGHLRGLYGSYNERRSLGYRSALTYVNGTNASDATKTVDYNDDVNCSSPWDFTIDRDDLTNRRYAQQRVIGTCYVYLERRGTVFTGTNTQGGRETRMGYQLKDPEAIDSSNPLYRFAPSANSKPAPVSSVTGDSPPNYYERWRAYIQANASKLGDDQPHQMYEGAGRQGALDRAKSAKQMADRSYCTEAPRAIFSETESCLGNCCRAGTCPTITTTTTSTPTPRRTPPTTGSGTGSGPLTIDVTVPEVFQAGGTQRPGVVTAVSGGFSCLGDCYGPTRLTYELTLTGVGGFIDCRGTPSRTCDFEVTDDSSSDGSGEDGSIRNSQDIQAAFYSAGNTAKQIQVGINGSSGTYRIRHEHETCSGFGDDRSCSTYTETHPRGFTPDVRITKGGDVTVQSGSNSVLVDVVGANNQTNVR